MAPGSRSVAEGLLSFHVTFSHRRFVGMAPLGLLVLLLSACKVGPSAFDRPGDDSDATGPEDTADVSTLPVIPDAPSVETLTVAEAPDTLAWPTALASVGL